MILATIENKWDFDGTTSTFIISINYDIETEKLTLDVNKQMSFKYSTFVYDTFEETVDIGSLKSPNRYLIRVALGKYKQQKPFKSNGWVLQDGTKGLTIANMFKLIEGNSSLSRNLKLQILKKKIEDAK